MGDYTYHLSLWVEHPDADLAEIPGKLGMPARVLWKKGDPWIAKSGELRGHRRKSYCNIEFPKGNNDLPDGLSAAVERLRPHANYIDELHKRGIILMFSVGWFLDWNSGDVLDWKILSELASLHISLSLDCYGPDSDEDAP